jgi:hypothetical protein
MELHVVFPIKRLEKEFNILEQDVIWLKLFFWQLMDEKKKMNEFKLWMHHYLKIVIMKIER